MGFLDWLNSAPSIQPPAPPAPEAGPREDIFDEPVVQQALKPADNDGDGIPDSIAGVCISIEYGDSIGEISTRRVLIERLYFQNNQLYIYGWCFLRDARRTFRADRILKLLLPPDWREVRDPYEFLEGYVSPSQNSRKENAAPALDVPVVRSNDYWERRYKVRAVANHGLRVLTFMARVDGAFALEERDVLNTYVKNISAVAGVRLNDEESADIASEVEALFPTKRQVANSLAAIRLYQEQSSLLLDSLKKLVRSDEKISSWEQNAMKMLIDILKKQNA